jgi:hypothetical protein
MFNVSMSRPRQVECFCFQPTLKLGGDSDQERCCQEGLTPRLICPIFKFLEETVPDTLSPNQIPAIPEDVVKPGRAFSSKGMLGRKTTTTRPQCAYYT